MPKAPKTPLLGVPGPPSTSAWQPLTPPPSVWRNLVWAGHTRGFTPVWLCLVPSLSVVGLGSIPRAARGRLAPFL